MNLLDNYLDRK